MINLASPAADGSLAGYVDCLRHVCVVLGVVAVCCVVLFGGERCARPLSAMGPRAPVCSCTGCDGAGRVLESTEGDMPLCRRIYSLTAFILCLAAAVIPIQQGSSAHRGPAPPLVDAHAQHSASTPAAQGGPQ